MKRLRSKQYPPGIDPAKLPKRCYWDGARKHWYTVYEAEGKQRRVKIADAAAKLSDLHRAMELRAGVDTGNLIWLRKKFTASIQYTQLAPKTRKGYDYCAGVVEGHKSKLANLTIGKVPLSTWNPDASQKLIDMIAVAQGPSTAAHCYRYLRRLFNWGEKRGYAKSPLGKIELPKERKRRRLPALDVLGRLIPFAQERGALTPHAEGSCSPYIWKVLIVARRCRLRGVEILLLTDAAVLENGLYGRRTKGSRDSITMWTPDLKQAVAAAQAERDAIWSKRSRAIPMRAENRPLFVNEGGEPITSSAWQTAWRRFMRQAIDAKIITEDERFGLHDMKRRSITDTKGGRAAKLDAGGHKDERMLDVYDFAVPVVPAADAEDLHSDLHEPQQQQTEKRVND